MYLFCFPSASTIEMLPEIAKAVNGKCEIYLDGGVCRGTDVFKALALGARAVFIGRPVLWGLAHNVSITTFFINIVVIILFLL